MLPLMSLCTAAKAAEPSRSALWVSVGRDWDGAGRTEETDDALRGLQEGDGVDTRLGHRDISERLDSAMNIRSICASVKRR